MAGESGVTGIIIDEIHSSHIQRDQIEGESGVTQVSLMNSFLRYPRRSNGRWKWCYSKFH